MGALGTLIPLAVLFCFVGVFAWVGFQMYVFTNELAERGKNKMEKKNIMFTKDGMKVGVKTIPHEDYADKTQNVLVKAWNLAAFPGYKSKLWNTEATPDFKRTPSSSATTTGARPSASRHSSSQSTK